MISGFAAQKLSCGFHMRLHHSFILAIGAGALVACGDGLPPTLAGLAPPASGTHSDGTSALLVTPNPVSLLVGGAYQLSMNAPLSLQNQVEWNSQQSTVASISPSGVVNAIGVGIAIVTARYAFDTTNVASTTINVTGTASP